MQSTCSTCQKYIVIRSAFKKSLWLCHEVLSKCFFQNYFQNGLLCQSRSKSSEIILPTEVWIHIWSFLDFKILQKICTLVSKGWLHDIRNSTRLSGELILRVCKYGGVSDINGALSRWPKLKVQYLSNCSCNYNRCNCISFQLSKLASHWETSNDLDSFF